MCIVCLCECVGVCSKLSSKLTFGGKISALHLAARHGDVEMVKVLLECGVSVSLTNSARKCAHECIGKLLKTRELRAVGVDKRGGGDDENSCKNADEEEEEELLNSDEDEDEDEVICFLFFLNM